MVVTCWSGEVVPGVLPSLGCMARTVSSTRCVSRSSYAMLAFSCMPNTSGSSAAGKDWMYCLQQQQAPFTNLVTLAVSQCCRQYACKFQHSTSIKCSQLNTSTVQWPTQQYVMLCLFKITDRCRCCCLLLRASQLVQPVKRQAEPILCNAHGIPPVQKHAYELVFCNSLPALLQ